MGQQKNKIRVKTPIERGAGVVHKPERSKEAIARNVIAAALVDRELSEIIYEDLWLLNEDIPHMEKIADRIAEKISAHLLQEPPVEGDDE